jgi:hypothetical protein
MSGSTSSSGLEELAAVITAKGDEIRLLKAAKADPALIKAHVDELLALKETVSCSLPAVL